MNKILQNLLFSLIFISLGYGQVLVPIAEDNAINYDGASTPDFSFGANSNGGFGFNPWSWENAGSSFSAFLGHGVNDSHGDIGDPSFGLFAAADGASEVFAKRSFDPLKNGDVFTTRFTINFRNRFKGISLFKEGQEIFLFQATSVNGDKYEYRDLNSGGNFIDLNWSFQSNSIFELTATQVSQNQVDIKVERTNSTGDIIELLNYNISGRIDEIRYFVGDAGGNEQNFYFNNLKIERPTFNTIADGNFSDTTIWENGDKPDGSFGAININHEVSLDESLTLDAMLNINENSVLAVDENQVFTNNGCVFITGDFVFRSTGNGTAQYGISQGSIDGEVTVERFIPARRAFRFVSSAVGDVSIADSWQQIIHITGAVGPVGSAPDADGFDKTPTGNASMYSFDNTLQQWNEIPNTSSTNLIAGEPYRLMVRGSRQTVTLLNNSPSSDVSLSAKGNMHIGTFNVPNPATAVSDLTFVGNPYQAIVDLEDLTYGNGVNNNFAYYWDPNLSDRGAFVQIDIPSNTNEVDPEVPNPGTSNASKFLQPGQAVFFRNSDDPALTDYSITFEEADKATSEPALSVFSTDDNTTSTPYINIRLYETNKFNNGEKEQDAVGIRFYADGNNAVDNNDARKLGNLSENLAIEHSTDLLAIEKRALPTLEDELQLLINNHQHQEYTFRIDAQNFDESTQPLLVDTYTNETYPLVNGITNISFTADEANSASMNNQRFLIQFENTTLSQTEFNGSIFSIYPNPVQDVLHLSWKEMPTGDTKISIFNLVGKRIASYQQDASDQVQTISAQSLEAGVYLLQIQNEDVNVTKKFIKR